MSQSYVLKLNKKGKGIKEPPNKKKNIISTQFIFILSIKLELFRLHLYVSQIISKGNNIETILKNRLYMCVIIGYPRCVPSVYKR